MSDLRPCCQQAVLDGFTPEEHAPHCQAPRPAPPVQDSPDVVGHVRTTSDAPTPLTAPTPRGADRA